MSRIVACVNPVCPDRDDLRKTFVSDTSIAIACPECGDAMEDMDCIDCTSPATRIVFGRGGTEESHCEAH